MWFKQGEITVVEIRTQGMNRFPWSTEYFRARSIKRYGIKLCLSSTRLIHFPNKNVPNIKYPRKSMSSWNCILTANTELSNIEKKTTDRHWWIRLFFWRNLNSHIAIRHVSGRSRHREGQEDGQNTWVSGVGWRHWSSCTVQSSVEQQVLCSNNRASCRGASNFAGSRGFPRLNS